MNGRICVIGLGLMGGSFALALARTGRSVVGCDRDPIAVQTAVARGAITNGYVSPDRAVRGCSHVALAVPVLELKAVAESISPEIEPGCVVFDLGSAKRQVIADMDEVFAPSVSVVGAHPMCGSEKCGIEYADPDMFRDRPFVICPIPGRSGSQEVEELASAIHAVPAVMDAATHDEIVAATSHLPYLAACALATVVRHQQASLPTTTLLAAAGFFSSTRLAAGSVTMGGQMVLANRDQILRRLDRFISELNLVRDMLGDPAALAVWLAAARSARAEVAGEQP